MSIIWTSQIHFVGVSEHWYILAMSSSIKITSSSGVELSFTERVGAFIQFAMQIRLFEIDDDELYSFQFPITIILYDNSISNVAYSQRR